MKLIAIPLLLFIAIFASSAITSNVQIQSGISTFCTFMAGFLIGPSFKQKSK